MAATGPGSMLIYDGRMARRGRRLNALFLALRHEANRAVFRRDPAVLHDRFQLTAEERAMVDQRDWAALFEAGLSIYAVAKAQAVLGGGDLYDIGAELHGMERAEFVAAQRLARGEG